MTSNFAQCQPIWQQPVNIKARNRHRKVIPSNIRVGSVTLVFTLIILIALLGVGIIGRTHENAVKGYEIEQLLKEIKVLNVDNEVLGRQIAEARSSQKVSESTIVKGMERTLDYKSVVYGEGSQIALKQ